MAAVQRMRQTRATEKLLTSAVNVAVALLLFLPFLLLDWPVWKLKLVLIGLFFGENVVAILFFAYRLPGMVLQGAQWQRAYPLRQQLLHATLYSASFATLVYWVWFPGDLLLVNLLLL